MSKFNFKAKDGRGNLVADSMIAENQREVITTLRRRGLVVVNIEEVAAKGRKRRSARRVRIGDLAIFARQLSTMVNAGLPLLDSLRTLYEQIESYGFQQVIGDVVSQVESGSSFAEAVTAHPNIFGSFFISMVRAGEASGELAEILIRIADYLESVNSLRRKVKMAMIYPSIISIMAVLITLVLLLKVIPIFEDIYRDLGATLPVPTQILILISTILRRWFWLIIIGAVVGLMFLGRFKKTERGREIFDRIKLRIPIFGQLFHKVAISRFSRTLGTLIKSGVPILGSLEIVKQVSGNKIIESALNVAGERIREGKSIEDPLSKSGVFPPMVVKMIAVGEKSGRLEEMLEKVSFYYDEQVATMVAGLASLIEPLLIALLGVVIGGIVMCMFLPIFRLSSIIGQG